MSVEDERKRIWNVLNDDNCYPDEMMKALDLDRLILEVRSEMPCRSGRMIIGGTEIDRAKGDLMASIMESVYLERDKKDRLTGRWSIPWDQIDFSRLILAGEKEKP